MAKPRFRILWMPSALADLHEAVQYIHADNPSAAKCLITETRSNVARLSTLPESGRDLPEFPASGLREIIVWSYRIIYRVLKKERRVEILAVVHGARELTGEKLPYSS